MERLAKGNSEYMAGLVAFSKHLRIDSNKIFQHFADQSSVNKRLRGILIKFIVPAKSAIFA